MDLELMKQLCQLDENKIHRLLVNTLGKRYKNVNETTNYIFAEGDLPICLVAHLDTVFNHQPRVESFIYDSNQKILWAPHGSGFDDRAGVYAILELILKGYRPHIIFTHGEEKGGIGSYDFIKDYPKCPFEDCKALIQLDRANEKDMVFYECDNKSFTDYIEKFGFELDWGTFTDISILAPEWKIAAVNLSVGYIEEHTPNERLYCDWCDATIEKVSKILDNANNMDKYKYVARPRMPYYYGNMAGISLAYSYCLLCGQNLGPKDGHWIYDEDFPYKVCDDCFKTYYEDVEPINRDIIPFN